MGKIKKVEALNNWNDVNEVALHCLGDAVECMASIEIVEHGNKPNVVQNLARAGAFEVATHLRDATLFRLHMIVCRAFAPVHSKDDRHLRAAIIFLREHIEEEPDEHSRKELARAIELFDAANGDPRLEKLARMRNKLLAHIARPKVPVDIATYRELFDVTGIVIEIWYALAKGTGQASLPLDYFLRDYRESLNAFWARWDE